ncbi:MAG: hypothetical protein AB1724_11350 [Thermodesulfobacteriota bacterium]
MKKPSLFSRREFMRRMALGAGMILPLSTGAIVSAEPEINGGLTIRRLPCKTESSPNGATIKAFGVGRAGLHTVLRLFEEYGRIDDTIEYILVESHGSEPIRSIPAFTKEQFCELSDIINHSQLVFIIAGLEEHTTADVVPVISDIGKKMGKFTLSVVSMPSDPVSTGKKLLAEQRLEAWRRAGDCVITVSNDNISNTGSDGNVVSAQSVDILMAAAVSGISQALCSQGVLGGLDLANIKLMMSGAKELSFGIGWGWGKKRAETAVSSAWRYLSARKRSMLFKGVLLALIAPYDLSFYELEAASDTLYKALPKNVPTELLTPISLYDLPFYELEAARDPLYEALPDNLSTEFLWTYAINPRIGMDGLQAVIYGC